MTFATIVADPPWPYKDRMRGNMTTGEMRSVDFDEYPTMSIDEIAALPVHELSDTDSHLYLWTTQKFIRDAYTVLDAWGFKQGALLVWSKPPKGVCGTYVCSSEFCIFGRRGNLGHKRRQIGTCYEWPRGKHSSKPEAFMDMVESVSPGPYLEMFARRKRTGWSSWGNEIESDIQIAA
jgi:N6-adenosine-specific RNA methylase IME4